VGVAKKKETRVVATGKDSTQDAAKTVGTPHLSTYTKKRLDPALFATDELMSGKAGSGPKNKKKKTKKKKGETKTSYLSVRSGTYTSVRILSAVLGGTKKKTTTKEHNKKKKQTQPVPWGGGGGGGGGWLLGGWGGGGGLFVGLFFLWRQSSSRSSP